MTNSLACTYTWKSLRKLFKIHKKRDKEREEEGEWKEERKREEEKKREKEREGENLIEIVDVLSTGTYPQWHCIVL